MQLGFLAGVIMTNKVEGSQMKLINSHLQTILTRAHTHTHTHMHTRMHAHMHTHTHAHTHTHTRMHTRTHTKLHITGNHRIPLSGDSQCPPCPAYFWLIWPLADTLQTLASPSYNTRKIPIFSSIYHLLCSLQLLHLFSPIFLKSCHLFIFLPRKLGNFML